jgi:hypothetical protein
MMPAESPRMAIHVVVPTLNRLEQCQLSISSILRAAARDGTVSVAVVDNGSTDGTWEWVQSLPAVVTCSQLRRATIGALRNAGAARSRAGIISFIDSDCIIDEDYFTRLRTCLNSTSAGAVGCMYGIPANAHWIERTWMALNCPVREGDTNALPGGSMAVTRAVFESVGGFDERMLTGEDAELCDRIRACGHRVYESPSLRLIHLRNMSSLKGFFDKQVWHSLGMLGGKGNPLLDRMTGMTLVHIVLSLAAIAVLCLMNAGAVIRLSTAAGLLLLVPAMAVTYRVLFRQGAVIPIRSVLLYAVYFFARSWGLVLIASGRTQKG